jgi:hypothetical protein
MQGEHCQQIMHKLPLDSEGFTLSFNAHNFNPEAVA